MCLLEFPIPVFGLRSVYEPHVIQEVQGGSHYVVGPTRLEFPELACFQSIRVKMAPRILAHISVEIRSVHEARRVAGDEFAGFEIAIGAGLEGRAAEQSEGQEEQGDGSFHGFIGVGWALALAKRV